jgi:hypothetical protein
VFIVGWEGNCLQETDQATVVGLYTQIKMQNFSRYKNYSTKKYVNVIYADFCSFKCDEYLCCSQKKKYA